MTAPQLDDRRIEAMKASIMHAVDADVARRGRRARRELGALAAACFVVVLGLVGFTQLAGPQEESADSAGASRTGVAADEAAPDSRVAARDAREVITTGSVDVTVDDPREVAETFSAWVESRSGRVDGRTESTDGEGRAFAALTVRVPRGDVSRTLAELATYGDVGTVDIQNEDVTAQGQDLDARIKALQISIDRLERILAGAGSSAEVVRAENALTQRQEQLERLQAQRTALTDQVVLSTLRVELVQADSASSVFPGGFQGGFVRGWDALVDTVNGIVALAGVLAPWLAVALLAWVLWRAARRVSRA